MFVSNYNGKDYCFYDDHLTIDGLKLDYRRMTNIAHRAGETPAMVFNYDGQRITMPYNKEDYKTILSYFVYANKLTPDTEAYAVETSAEPEFVYEPEQEYVEDAGKEYVEPDPSAVEYVETPTVEASIEPEFVYEPEQEYVEAPAGEYVEAPAWTAPAESEFIYESEQELVVEEPAGEYIEPEAPAGEYVETPAWAAPAESEFIYESEQDLVVEDPAGGYIEPEAPAGEYVETPAWAAPAESEFIYESEQELVVEEPAGEYIEPEAPAEEYVVLEAPAEEYVEDHVEESASGTAASTAGGVKAKLGRLKSIPDKIKSISKKTKLICVIVVAAIIVGVILFYVFMGSSKSVEGMDGRISPKPITTETGETYNVSTVDTDINLAEFVPDYYYECFEEGDTVHWVINKKTNETIMMSDHDENVLVCVFEHVDGEEKDPSILGSGNIKETWIMDLDSDELVKV